MAFGAGHQCQPSRLCARATRRPIGAERRRRQRRSFAGRKRRIAGQPRNAKVALRPARSTARVLVGQRPIVGHAVERAHAKIRRHVPLPVRGVNDGAAADRVVEHGGDVGIACRRWDNRPAPGADWDCPDSRGYTSAMRYIMRERILSWGDDFAIKDADGRDAFYVDGRALSFGDKLSFQDMQGTSWP